MAIAINQNIKINLTGISSSLKNLSLTDNQSVSFIWADLQNLETINLSGILLETGVNDDLDFTSFTNLRNLSLSLTGVNSMNYNALVGLEVVYLSGDFPTISSVSLWPQIKEISTKDITISNLTISSNLPTAYKVILRNCSLSSTAVDDILNSLTNANGNSIEGGYINLSGNSSRTSASDAAFSELASRNWSFAF